MYLRASDAFKQILKMVQNTLKFPNFISKKKKTLAQTCKRKHEIMTSDYYYGV